jgi:hypothetical protein
MERQIAPAWRKSSYSSGNGGNCVETGSTHGAVLVRDTKNQGSGPVLRVPASAWVAFTATLK